MGRRRGVLAGYGRTRLKRENLTLLAAGLCVGGVAVAVIAQIGYGMEPCAWCTFQRLIYLVIALLALLAWGLNRGPVAKALSWVAAVVALGGVASALYQHFVAAHSDSCSMSLADKVIKGPGLDQLAPWLFQATAFCNESNVLLAGVPFALWSAALFVIVAIILVVRAIRPR